MYHISMLFIERKSQRSSGNWRSKKQKPSKKRRNCAWGDLQLRTTNGCGPKVGDPG